MGPDTPRHETGTITPYVDILGRSQLAVTGPKAHILITRKSEFDPYEVWYSDRLDTIARTPHRDQALQIACRKAGIEL